MKILKYILPIFCLIVFACKNAPERPDSVLSEGSKAAQQLQTNTTTSTTPPGAEPAQNSAGVWHYTCPSGCAGGAAGAGLCATCGATLTHNTAYHNSGTNTTPAPVTAPGIQTTSGTNPIQVPPPTQKAPEPAQNAAGVWHYTCPSGCAGGGAGATACGSCGATLAHNTAYHN